MRKSFLILILLVVVSGCGKSMNSDQSRFMEENSIAAKELAKGVQKSKHKGLKGVLVMPFTAIDKQHSSRFGTVVADSLGNQLSQRGVPILNGEQEDETMPIGASSAGWMAKLSGDYAIAADCVYVSARVVRLESGDFVAAHSWAVPLNDPFISTLLQR